MAGAVRFSLPITVEPVIFPTEFMSLLKGTGRRLVSWGRELLGSKARLFLSVVGMRKDRHLLYAPDVHAPLMRPTCVLPELATHLSGFCL